MNLNSLILSSVILFSNGVADNTLNVNSYVNNYYMNENTTTSSNSVYDEFIIYNENHNNTLFNFYLSFENGIFSLNATTDFGLDGLNHVSVSADTFFNDYVLNDIPISNRRGFYGYLYGDGSNQISVVYSSVDIDTHNTYSETINLDGDNLPVQLGTINNSPQYVFFDNENIMQWCKQVLSDYNNSLSKSLFEVLGETISAYVSSITSMFNDLMLLFYADNKLTYLSQLLLVGIGIGITKWGMNFVKDRVRL